MFEKKDLISWKIPVIIVAAIVVLGSGILVGAKTRNMGKSKGNDVVVSDESLKTVFKLSKNCEIWIEKKSEGLSDLNTQSTMVGLVGEELLNKSEEEIREYLTTKYPGMDIDSIDKDRIVLSEYVDESSPSLANKYIIQDDNGYITLYKYDASGKKQVLEKTQIEINSLPQIVQDEIRKGVITETEDDAYSKLQSFGS